MFSFPSPQKLFTLNGTTWLKRFWNWSRWIYGDNLRPRDRPTQESADVKTLLGIAIPDGAEYHHWVPKSKRLWQFGYLTGGFSSSYCLRTKSCLRNVFRPFMIFWKCEAQNEKPTFHFIAQIANVWYILSSSIFHVRKMSNCTLSSITNRM